jgi:osmotically-inducible protein OsmY
MVHGLAQLTNDALSKSRAISRTTASMLLVDRAKALLHGSSHQALRSVSCVYYAGILRLRGWVPSYYLKQVAQSLLLSMEEAPQVQNELVVGQPCKPRKTK